MEYLPMKSKWVALQLIELAEWMNSTKMISIVDNIFMT